MARHFRLCLIALALALPASGFAAESDLGQIRDHARSVLSIPEENPRCRGAYQTCAAFCEKNYDTCARGREAAVADRRCSPGYDRCTKQCDRNEKMCSR